MEEMDRRVGEFMEKYSWVWEVEGAVGKLTAYFEMMEKRRRTGGCEGEEGEEPGCCEGEEEGGGGVVKEMWESVPW